VNLVVDASVFIGASSSRPYRQFLNEAVRRQWLRLSSIVVMELYAGFQSPESRRTFTELHRHLQRAGKLVVVEHRDFLLAGQVLFALSRRRGHLDFKDHFRDGLIAVSAARVGATVVTENERNFELWRVGLARSGQRLTLQVMTRE